ncbi:L,D-transpeptidase [candidate division WOR-3 bacterium]|nr:L,D-transpeptidase [candidate division WOR-3 bacterium]
MKNIKNITITILAVLVVLEASMIFFQYRKTTHSVERAAYFEGKRDSLNYVISGFVGSFSNLEYLVENLELENQSLKTDEYYMIINLSRQHFWIKKRDKIIWEGSCATGVGEVTRAGEKFSFHTPVGERRILAKKTEPYWIRPNWFWKEQGLAVPHDSEWIVIPDTLNFQQSIVFYDSLPEEEKLMVRAVPGALGNYALNLGDGILIHKGQIGRGVYSHGCIRLKEDDLEVADSLLPIGASVFIF